MHNVDEIKHPYAKKKLPRRVLGKKFLRSLILKLTAWKYPGSTNKGLYSDVNSGSQEFFSKEQSLISLSFFYSNKMLGFPRKNCTRLYSAYSEDNINCCKSYLRYAYYEKY